MEERTKYIFKLFFILGMSIIATSCSKVDEPEIIEYDDWGYHPPICHAKYLFEIWRDSKCIMPFERWKEKSCFVSETGDKTYEINEYSVEKHSPLTDSEKEKLQIDVDESLLNMPWYKLLRNGKECDILLFCYDPIDLEYQMPDVHNRRVYAYSKSLKKVFTAYKITSRAPIYAEEYGGTDILPDFYTDYNYIGVDDTNSRLNLKKERVYMYRTHHNLMQYNDQYCFIVTAFDKDMNIWCDAFDMIESKYGRLGIKDGMVPSQNLVKTEIIECTLGSMRDAYTNWFNNEYLISVRPQMVLEYKELFLDKD